MLQAIKKNKLLFLLLLTFPAVLLCTMTLLPTHDDWTSSPAPHPEPFSWSLLLPHLGYWRIPEIMYGWVCAHMRWLFPELSHVITVSGHYVGMIMIWKICTLLRFSSLSRSIATIFFLVSTGMIATITACDGMSQTWTHSLGLIALYISLNNNNSLKWLPVVFIACMIKENALTFFYIIPFIAFCTGYYSKNNLKRQIPPILFLTIAYISLRLMLPVADSEQVREEYFEGINIPMILRGIALTIAYPLLPIDYAALVQTEHRNIFMVMVTLFLSIPFLYIVMLRSICSKLNRMSLTFLVAAFLCVGIHIVTIFSLMHVYSCMGMMALFLATIINRDKTTKARTYNISFMLYALTAISVDAHHYISAYRSGVMGQQLAKQAIKKTDVPADSVYIVYYDNGYKKYSNFHVIPIEAMGWGIATQWETEYKWPKTIENEYISNVSSIDSIVNSKLNEGYDCVWFIHSDSPKQTANGNVILDVISR